MTFRKLLETIQQFAAENPDHEALDRHVGGLQSAVVDAGCTDEFALVLDADQEPDEDNEAQEGS